MGRKLWEGIRAAFHAVGLATNFVLLALFYFLVFGPFALLVRLLRRDFLALRPSGRSSFWRPREPEEPSLERARRQS